MDPMTATPADSGALVENIPAAVAGGEGPLTPSQAARSVIDWRNKRNAQAEEPRGEPAAPEPVPESAQAADTAPETPATGETEDANPVEETQPPLERPRSWSKERDEAWNKLDRGTQEYLLDYDRKTSAEVRKAQNETAEKLKGLTAKEREIEEARTKYESALPALLETLQQERNGEFSDVKTVADLEKLSREDPFRYLQWTARQQKIAAVENQLKEAQDRQAKETQTRWAEFAKREDDLVLEHIPELADAAKAPALREKAISVLEDVGFKKNELADLFNGKSAVSLRDNRIQQLVFKALKYDEAQKAAKVAAKKPLAPVQKPGVAANRGSADQADIKSLEKQLDNATGMNALRLGQQLAAARRAAASR